jgi:arsenate reductase
MAELTVYTVPTCTTCRNLAALLGERGIAFTPIDYHVTGLTEPELRGLLAKAALGPREVLRMREARAQDLDVDALSDDALIASMVANPRLVERPIVAHGDRAVLARPIERALEIL